MDISFYEMRIATIDEAARRNRWIFAATIVASIAIVGAAWNSAPFGLYEFAETLWKAGDFIGDKPTIELQKALLKGWVESQFVNVPLFGIRFSVNDTWILGTTTLFILSIWEFYGLRRENHLIGGLARDAACEDARTRALVFFGICGTQVFTTLTDDDRPITSLQHQRTEPIRVRGIRLVVWVLYFLPILVMLSAITLDVTSVFVWGAPFRFPHLPLMDLARDKNALFREIAIEDGAALVITIVTAVLLWRTYEFQRGTITLLRTLAAAHWGAISPGADPISAEQKTEQPPGAAGMRGDTGGAPSQHPFLRVGAGI